MEEGRKRLNELRDDLEMEKGQGDLAKKAVSTGKRKFLSQIESLTTALQASERRANELSRSVDSIRKEHGDEMKTHHERWVKEMETVTRMREEIAEKENELGDLRKRLYKMESSRDDEKDEIRVVEGRWRHKFEELETIRKAELVKMRNDYRKELVKKMNEFTVIKNRQRSERLKIVDELRKAK